MVYYCPPPRSTIQDFCRIYRSSCNCQLSRWRRALSSSTLFRDCGQLVSIHSYYVFHSAFSVVAFVGAFQVIILTGYLNIFERSPHFVCTTHLKQVFTRREFLDCEEKLNTSSIDAYRFLCTNLCSAPLNPFIPRCHRRHPSSVHQIHLFP